MYEPIDDNCEKSSIGHDMEIEMRTIEDVRLYDDINKNYHQIKEYLLIRVVCRNCGIVAWERFKSVDWVKEGEIND